MLFVNLAVLDLQQRSPCLFHGCRIQQLMLSNTIVKLSAVFLFATPAVLIGGEVYSILTGSSPLEGFLKIYSVLYIIPGTQPCCPS